MASERPGPVFVVGWQRPSSRPLRADGDPRIGTARHAGQTQPVGRYQSVRYESLLSRQTVSRPIRRDMGYR